MTEEIKNEEHALDWDSQIKNDGNENKIFELLPEGKYRFGVKKMEKSNCEKLKCPMARLTIGIYADNDLEYQKELTTVKDQIVLDDRFKWKIFEFFHSIGDYNGEPTFKYNWENVPGAAGRCKLRVDEYTKRDGTKGKSNKIEKYLDPEPPKDTAAPKKPAEEDNLKF